MLLLVMVVGLNNGRGVTVRKSRRGLRTWRLSDESARCVVVDLLRDGLLVMRMVMMVVLVMASKREAECGHDWNEVDS